MLTKQPKILIVDDEPMLLFSLSAFFEDEEFTVFSAETGERALELLAQNEIDVAVLDMRLPGIDGNEVIEQACSEKTATRFIIHTGSLEYSVPPSIRQYGITESNIISKPVFDLNILLDAVNALIQDRADH